MSNVLVPLMSKSEIEELPEELRKILLNYVTPLYESLYKSIPILLGSTNIEEFERNFKVVTSDVLEYSVLMGLALSEEQRMRVVSYYLKHSQVAAAADKTPLARTIVDANEIIANFIWLNIEPKYRDLIPDHPGVYLPFLHLVVYNFILTYIYDVSEKGVEPSMVSKIKLMTQEATWTVEGYVDTIEILGDPEARTALERIRQTPF
jgi:hypothetical protein